MMNRSFSGDRFIPEKKDYDRAASVSSDAKASAQIRAIKDLDKLCRRCIAFMSKAAYGKNLSEWVARANELGATADDIDKLKTAVINALVRVDDEKSSTNPIIVTEIIPVVDEETASSDLEDNVSNIQRKLVPYSGSVKAENYELTKLIVRPLFPTIPNRPSARELWKLEGALFLTVPNFELFDVDPQDPKLWRKINELYDQYQDILTKPAEVTFDKIVQLMDYNLGPYDGFKLVGMTTSRNPIKGNYLKIDSLNEPDKYLHRFLLDLVQQQKISGTLSGDPMELYGIGNLFFDFSIADFNFRLQLSGSWEGLYSEIGVDKMVDMYGMMDILAALGYSRGKLPSGDPKCILSNN